MGGDVLRDEAGVGVFEESHDGSDRNESTGSRVGDMSDLLSRLKQRVFGMAAERSLDGVLDALGSVFGNRRTMRNCYQTHRRISGMARATIDDYRIKDVRIRIEFDSGGPVGATTVVSVGKEDDWFVNRWFYFDEDNENYIRNFAQKVATDEDYRNRCLNRTADWTRVADQYEQTARQILEYFQDAEVMGYSVGDKEEEDEYRRAKSEMETICESLFTALKSEIRGGNDTTEVERIADDHKDRAWRWLRENGYLDETEASDLA